MQMDALKRWPEEDSSQDGRVGGEHQDYCVTGSCQQDWKRRHKWCCKGGNDLQYQDSGSNRKYGEKNVGG